MSYQALLFCPDEKTARVVTQVLAELEFSVELSNEPFATVKKLMAKPYDAIVVDCDNEQNAALLFKSARNSTSNQTSLAVAVVDGQAGVAKAFRIGANLVLTKPVNVEQSKGTLRVARGLLRKADAGKTSAASLSPLAAGTASVPFAMSSSSFDKLTPPSAMQRPTSPASFRAGSASIAAIPVPAASSESIEMDQDPTPQLDATEAAFLQSIPEPAATHPAKAPEESPWLQLSKPAGDSKEVASPRNSEPKTKTQFEPQSRISSPTTSRIGTGSSAAFGAAVAPAKEKPAPSFTDVDSVKTAELETDPGSFKAPKDSLQGHDDAQDAPSFAASSNEATTSKLPLVAALVAIALAAGYFGWGKLQLRSVPAPTQTQAPIAQTQLPTPAPIVPEPEASQPVEDAASKPPQHLPQLNQNPTAEARTASSGKSSADQIVVIESKGSDTGADAKPISVREIHEPLVIKNAAPSGVQQTLAPPQIQAGSDPGSQTIAGLIPVNPAPMPTHGSGLRISHGISEGVLVKKVNPVYPSQALHLRREGVVKILASITKTGSIASAKLLAGDPILGAAAVTAVKQWKYQPYTLNGEPSQVDTQISVSFKLP
jgi:TonB family protein